MNFINRKTHNPAGGAERDKMKDLCGKIFELLPPVLLAVFGGFTRTLVGKQRNESYNWRVGLTEMSIAAFAGVVIHLLLSEFKMPESCKSAAVAIAGYSAREILNLLRGFLIKKIKKEFKE